MSTPGDAYAKCEEFKGQWFDPKADGKTHYYYICGLHADGEIA